MKKVIIIAGLLLALFFPTITFSRDRAFIFLSHSLSTKTESKDFRIEADGDGDDYLPSESESEEEMFGLKGQYFRALPNLGETTPLLGLSASFSTFFGPTLTFARGQILFSGRPIWAKSLLPATLTEGTPLFIPSVWVWKCGVISILTAVLTPKKVNWTVTTPSA